MPNDQYWGKWTEVDLGITPWYHRPLGTMVLNLAYIKEAIGAWNETRWADAEFGKLVKQTNGTLDVDDRRKIFCKIEDIMMERGPIGNAYWQNKWYTLSKKIIGVEASPSLYMNFNEVWLDA